MYARLLAAFCLTLSCVPAFAEPGLVVHLKMDASQAPTPVAHMKRELASLMHSAGYQVQWGDESSSSYLVVVELSGDCSLPAGYASAPRTTLTGAALASTVVTDGRVLPFASVNCAAITRSLSDILIKDAAAQRDFLYGRAMARVIAHELYHILTGTTDHARNGIARSCVTNTDLLSEQFQFEASTLAALRPRSDAPISAASDEDIDR